METPGDAAVSLRRGLGLRIAHLRAEKGLTQTELARRLGVGRSRLAKWEGGAHAPSLDKLVELAAALGCSLDELVTGRPAERRLRR